MPHADSVSVKLVAHISVSILAALTNYHERVDRMAA